MLDAIASAPHRAAALCRDRGAGRRADPDARDGARRSASSSACSKTRPMQRCGRPSSSVDADHIQFADPAFRARARLLDAPADRRRPATVSPAPASASPTGRRAPRRRCSASSISAAPSRAWTSRTCSARRCSASSPRRGDTRAEWIATGRALAAVLHTLTMHGLVNAFLNQPIEVDEPSGPKLAEPRRAGAHAAALEPLRLSEGRRRHAAARGAPPARRGADRRLKRKGLRRAEACNRSRRELVSASRTRPRGSVPSCTG